MPGDKIPLLTMGYGRSESRNGAVFPWNFIAVGSYWTAADVAIQHIAQELGGIDKLKGKKISLVYHDSPYGKEPILALEERAKKNGFTFKAIPVTHPGVEQKSQWLAIRQDRPDYVLLWGWGVMNSTAIKEAAAVGYPRDKMIGVWWSGAEPDVTPAGDQSKGYKALMLQHGAGKFEVHDDLEKFVLAKGKSVAKDDFAQVLYNRGLLNSMLGTEAIRTAMKKYGNKPMTGEQVRWGFENLDLTAARIKELGFEGMLSPIKLSCQDHQGADVGARPAVGRQGVEGDLRLLQGRPVDPRPDGQGAVGQVRGRQEDHAARLLEGELMRLTIRAAAETAARFLSTDGRPMASAAPAASAAPEAAFLSVNNIEVVYSHVILVLKGVSLSVPKGGIVALLGANGAGKTTTLKAISNLLHAERGEVTKGSIEFDGEVVHSLSPNASRAPAAASR